MTVILLAGGQSSRMGNPKGLLKLGESYWIEEQVTRLASSGLTEIIVVLGYHLEAYFSRVPWLKEFSRGTGARAGLHIRVTVNPEPARGQFSSLQTGLGQLAPSSGAFVLPIDVPCPDRAVWKEIISARERHPSADAIIPQHQGKGGHPLYLSSAFLRRLLKLDSKDAESRLDFQLKNLAEGRLVQVPVAGGFGPEILLNINTPEDWRKFLASCEAGRSASG